MGGVRRPGYPVRMDLVTRWRKARESRRASARPRGPGSDLESEAQRLAHVGTWEWDVARNAVVWSEELHRIYGVRPGEFNGTLEDFLRRVHPDDRGLTSEVILTALREAKPFSCDHRLIRPDGAVRMVETRGDAVRGRGGAVIRLMGCCLDVTEQWEARRRLEESEALLRATLDATADGIFVLDESGRLTAFNRRALELWRVPEELARRGDPAALVNYVLDQLTEPKAFAASERNLKVDPEAKGYDMIRFKDGRVFERCTMPRKADGRLAGRVCSFRDVTRRERALSALVTLTSELEERVRRRTADLEEKARELERSNAELELFASSASHDLTSPLRKISAFASLLAQKAAGKLGPEEEALLDRIRRGAVDMSKLIAEVLTLARVSHEVLPVQDLSLDDVLADALAELEESVSQAGATVDAGRLPRVRGHASLWRRLFFNLLSNAFKFRALDRPPRVRVRSEALPGGGARLIIEDNGIGFDPRFSREIFEPFRRLHSASEYQGSGIGLAICERIVRRFGGTISARGEPGRGSTFTIELPASALSA